MYFAGAEENGKAGLIRCRIRPERATSTRGTIGNFAETEILPTNVIQREMRDTGRPLPAAQSRGALICLALLTMLGACLRIIALNKGLWWDEMYFVVISVRHPFSEIITVFPADTQHTLYSILARMSVLAFGEHPWTLRLPAVIFGVATIPALYLLGTAVASRTEALLAAGLLAVSYHHVWFSQNARGYTMLAFFTVLATFFLLRGIETGRRGFFIAYAVAAALGLYAHLTMAFLIASHLTICAVSAFSDRKQGRSLDKWKLALQGFLMAGAFSVVLYSPILTQVGNLFLHHPSTMRAVSTPSWAFLETLRGLIRGLGAAGVVMAAVVIVAGGAWSYLKQSRLVFALFALPGLMTAGGAFLARGTMYPRFYFYLIGFAILILVRGVTAISKGIAAFWPGGSTRLAPRLTGALAALLFVASGYSLMNNYRYPKQDFDGAIKFVDAERKEGETVATVGAAIWPLQQYYAKPWVSAGSVAALRTMCGQGKPVWVVYTFPRYLEAVAPGMPEMIRKDSNLFRVFHGTLGDGDVYVARFAAGACT